MAAIDLCTLDEVLAFLGQATVSPEMEAELEFLITANSTAAATFCSRDFISKARVEVRNGTGTALLVLRDSPVTAVASVTLGTHAVSQGSPGGSTGFVWDDCVLYLLGGEVFPRGVQNISIAYTAGYTEVALPSSTVPYDLRQAIVEAVAVTFKQRNNLGVVSKTIAGETITYMQRAWPEKARDTLRQYRAVAYG